MGYYPFQADRIYVSGKPIYDYSLYELRDSFAFVPQEAFLYLRRACAATFTSCSSKISSRPRRKPLIYPDLYVPLF